MISVVLACYNGKPFIEKQLLSIAQQTRLPDEVIICDDCSTDGTPQLCRDFIEKHRLTGWKVYENEHNMGFCLNFFRAIDKAEGDIIFLCDQDDEWLPEKCEKMAAAMEENPDILSLACRYDVIDGEGNLLPRDSVRYAAFDGGQRFADISVESLIGCSWVRGFSMCFSSELKKYLKPLELKDLLAHDWLINIVAAGVSGACFLNEVLTRYRSHGKNASLSAKRSRRRRTDGIAQSIEAHKFLLNTPLPNITPGLRQSIKTQIKFEEKRLHAICNRKPFVWLSLIRYLPRYARYYKEEKTGLRVWIGDLAYIIKK